MISCENLVLTNYTEQEQLPDFLKLTEECISSDARPGRSDEKWLNVIMKRSDTL